MNCTNERMSALSFQLHKINDNYILQERVHEGGGQVGSMMKDLFEKKND